MKTLLILFIFFANSNSIKQVRQLYRESIGNEQKAIELIDKCEMNSGNSLFAGYSGAAQIVLAKHKINPYSKYKCFIDGKNKLENAIEKDSTNLELRYLRLTIQSNCPVFLNYSSKIKSDRHFLKQHVQRTYDKELKELIVTYLNHLESKQHI